MTVCLDSLEQSPSWEANSRWASQEILHLIWNKKMHYRVYKKWPIVLILSQTIPAHILASCFCKIHRFIILPCSLMSPGCLFVDDFYKIPRSRFIVRSITSSLLSRNGFVKYTKKWEVVEITDVLGFQYSELPLVIMWWTVTVGKLELPSMWILWQYK
jgi:hypothetical protein